MRALTNELFLRFSLETGILDAVNENIEFLSVILLILAVLTCFFGFNIYRAEFSVLVFIAVTLVCCFVMRERTDWGTVTTAFAVLGTAFAFFAFRWHRLGGFVVAGLIAAAAVWTLSRTLWITVAAGLLAGVLVLMLPVIVICLMTSLWGTMVLYGYRSDLSFLNGNGYVPFFIIVAAGFLVQMLVNRRQKLFAKAYPRRLEHWIQERRGTV